MTRFILTACCIALLSSFSVNAATVDSFSSADDLDLDGPMEYAIDVYGAGDSVAGVNFTTDATAGVSIAALNTAEDWATKPVLTGTDAAALEDIMHDIRFGNHGGDLEIVLDVVAGQRYKLQLLFSENYWPNAGQRAFDVVIDGNLIIDEFDVAAAQGDPLGSGLPPRALAPSQGVVVSELLDATGPTLTIDLLQGTTLEDGNPFINAFTLKAIPEPSTSCLAILGALGILFRFGRRR